LLIGCAYYGNASPFVSHVKAIEMKQEKSDFVEPEIPK